MKNTESMTSKLKECACNLSVLYVEDDELVRESFQGILKNFFKDVKVCTNGKDALLELMDYHTYDLIISDIEMPQLDGLKMAELIKEKNPKQVILMMTAHSDKEYLLQSYKIGIEGYITKPFDSEEDIKTLLRICRKIEKEESSKVMEWDKAFSKL